MARIVENNFDPNKDYGIEEKGELGKIVCPVCNSKVYIENDDITSSGGGDNGICGPGFHSWYYKLFRCPACKHRVNGLDAKHWDEDEDGTLYVVEDRQAEEWEKRKIEKLKKIAEDLKKQGLSDEQIDFKVKMYSIDLDYRMI